MGFLIWLVGAFITLVVVLRYRKWVCARITDETARLFVSLYGVIFWPVAWFVGLAWLTANYKRSNDEH